MLCFLFISLQNLDVNSAVNNLLSHDDEDGGGDNDEAVLGLIPTGGKICMNNGPLLISASEMRTPQIFRTLAVVPNAAFACYNC